jgi:predicted phage tail protein
MLRKIKLYGKLAKFIGHRTLEADVATAAEAARFLVANWPELEKHMADQHYRVSLGSYDLSEDELHDPAGRQVIKIAPVVGGAGAVGKIIAGIALIVAGALIPGAGFLIGIGASLLIGGVAQLISPVPATPTGTDSEQDPQKSYSFSGIQNTSRQGTSVPIVYGEALVGSVVISAGIDTVQVTDSVSTGQSPGELAFRAMFKQA